MTQSEEQQHIIEQINNSNIIVNSCAGSGKTTVVLFMAQQYHQQQFLLLTFNRKLKDETVQRIEKKNLKNIDIYTYHSFLQHNMSNQQTINNDTKLLKFMDRLDIKKQYDKIIIDEAQDMTPLYAVLVQNMFHIFHLQKKQFKVCFIGDKRQSINQFNGSRSEFLTCADQIFGNNVPCQYWQRINLTVSFRLTRELALFVNQCTFLNEGQYINTIDKHGPKVKYLLIDQAYEKLAHIIMNLHKQGYAYDEMAFISVSVKQGGYWGPFCSQLSNFLSNNGVNIYMCTNDAENDSILMKNKFTFMSINKSKGLERKIIFFYSLNTVFDYVQGTKINQRKIPNSLYVALTRAKEQLYVLHKETTTLEYSKYLRVNNLSLACDFFLVNKQLENEILDERILDETQLNELQFQRDEKAKSDSDEKKSPKTQSISVVELVQYLPLKVELQIIELLKQCIDKFDLVYECQQQIISFNDIQEKTINGIEIVENTSSLTGVISEEFIWDTYLQNNIQSIDQYDNLQVKQADSQLITELYNEMIFFQQGNQIELYYNRKGLIKTYINEQRVYKLKQFIKDQNTQLDKDYQMKLNIIWQQFMKTYDIKQQIYHTLKNTSFRIQQKGININGIVDFLMENMIIELKTTNQIQITHFIQTIVYMFHFKMNASVFYPLLGKEIEITYNQQICEQILAILIKQKLSSISEDEQNNVHFVLEQMKIIQ